MRSSLSRNFLLGVGVTSVAFTIVASLSAFAVFQSELAHRQISFLSQYVQERTDNLDRRFTGLLALHRAAVTTLQRREALLKPDEVEQLLNRDFPLRADGTRRSRPEAFTGMVSPGGRLIYGMGAFLGDGAHIPAPESRALISAYPIVGSFGQAVHHDYDNFYFFTPHNRLVMFGPDRPDHLLFYREQAPANLDFSQEEMSRIIQPGANPTGATRCTSLQRLIQEKATARVGLACLTPTYVDGQFVGAFGSTISATALFKDAVGASLPGATSLILRSDGELLAYPGSMSAKGASEDQVAAYEHRLNLSALAHQVQTRHAQHGVLVSGDGKQIVAFGRLSGPGWYYLVTYPAMAVTLSAARSASVILALGLIASILQTLVILRMARGAITRPLQDLANSCEARAPARRRRAGGAQRRDRGAGQGAPRRARPGGRAAGLPRTAGE